MKIVNQIVKTPMFWGACALLVMAADPAFAQNLDPITNMLTTVIGYLTGAIGKGVAVIAVVAAGFAMFTGRLNYVWFFAILVGAVLVFSAQTIIDGF